MAARAHERSISSTGHPLRKRKVPSSKQKVHVVPKTVFLLDQANLNADDEEEDVKMMNTIKEEMILIRGEIC